MRNKIKYYKYAIGVLMILQILGCKTRKRITFESLLNEMADYSAPTVLPSYKSGQESSYDRRSISKDLPGWFANNDGFGIVRQDTISGRLEDVLFDRQGPGVITRIWMTALNKSGTLRFYFDGSDTANWIVPAYDMLKIGFPLGLGIVQPHTSYVEDGKGGSTFFLPIPYAKGCKITFEKPKGVKATPKYYHINYRTYPPGTNITTFSPAILTKDKTTIEKTNTALLLHPTFRLSSSINASAALRSGDSVLLELPKGQHRVRTLELSIGLADSSTYAQTMRELLLEVSFDGITTVRVPLSDFSGGGMGAPKVESWYLSSDGRGNITSRWVMPYKDKSFVKLTNFSKNTVNASLNAYTEKKRWTDDGLYFHAAWKQESEIPLTNDESAAIDWNFATIFGRGVYMGDVLSLFNHSPSWYGEGDEKIFVDGEDFPSHFGTGTEDYYNSSWAPVVPFHTPFGGAPRADLESSHGYNTFFRTRNLDVIPFHQKMQFDIEMLSWIKGSADYATTIFWYGDLTSKAANESGEEVFKKTLLPAPLPKEKFKVEGAIEFESLPIWGKSSDIECGAQNMSTFISDLWSNDEQLLCVGGREGDFVDFRISDLSGRAQSVEVYLTKAADYGKVEFFVNGQSTGVIFDGYDSDVKNSNAITLGKFIPENGHIDIRVQLVGTNENTVGNRYLIGLDCVKIIQNN